MAGKAFALVMLRDKFYRDGFHRVVLAFILSLASNVALIALIVYIWTHPPSPRYFPVSDAGRITPIQPLHKPKEFSNESTIIEWATKSAIAAYSFNYVNYMQELQAASIFFTPRGWDNFLDALVSSNNLEAIKVRKFIVNSEAYGVPKIIRQGVIKGRYTWELELQLLVTFRNEVQFNQQKLKIIMKVQRISSLNSPRGIGIDQFVVKPVEN